MYLNYFTRKYCELENEMKELLETISKEAKSPNYNSDSISAWSSIMRTFRKKIYFDDMMEILDTEKFKDYLNEAFRYDCKPKEIIPKIKDMIFEHMEHSFFESDCIVTYDFEDLSESFTNAFFNAWYNTEEHTLQEKVDFESLPAELKEIRYEKVNGEGSSPMFPLQLFFIHVMRETLAYGVTNGKSK